MRIRVCIPFYAEFETAKPGLEELATCTEHEFVIEERQGVRIAKLRNHLINDGKSSKKWQKPLDFDAFLDWDSDIDATLNDVLMMIKHDKDIVTLPYLRHTNHDEYECGWFKKDKPGIISKRANNLQKGFLKMPWTGGGMRLTKAHVYEKMEYPWYRNSLVIDGELQEETGEDIGFCLGATKAGFDIWCDFDNPVGHTKRDMNSFNWNTNNPENLIQRYHRESILHQINAEKSLSQVLAVAETMGWTPEKTNKILGSIVMAPAIENNSENENLIKKGI